MPLRPDDLPPDFAEALECVKPRLGRLGSELLFFPTIGSTNDVAASLAVSAEHEGAVVVADRQTAGRGRRGRTWFSPPASGLYVSVVLAPGRAREPDRAIRLTTIAAGVALAEAVQQATGLSAGIKWPNDLVVGRRKLAGILAEAVDSGRPVPDTHERYRANASASGSAAPRETRNVVLGYGINVGSAAYPPELADRATSLESELGRAMDRSSLFAETLAALAARYDDLLAGRFDAILDAWRQLAPAHRGARVSWETAAGPRSGITAGVDDCGALMVQVGDRIERIVAGELTWS